MIVTFRCSARLYLLHVHKLHILDSPPIQPLDRKKVVADKKKAPPFNQRTWQAPPRPDTFIERGLIITNRRVVAETMYIMKPIIHLGGMYVFGERSWKPWFISLTIEYISLQRLKSSKSLTAQQRLVLSKRTLNLVMYLVRSPFFENYSEKRFRAFLYWFVNSVPLVGPLMRPFLEYMQQWQETYFYIWSV
ncbi:Hypothetical protein CINCED_3A007593 [Cinara cedri]|uniref:Peroxisomal membrane protein PEX16 n=1 Tax=Cinara cedri TaxID=506608 RepID=A0A5E4MZ36_9HEMI|nr:Hypothetical protein CINCED_3A007593 [Cinara cedri]VVC36665.1 Hypothetical protein CINCED_3A007593 [Cinara cedri]